MSTDRHLQNRRVTCDEFQVQGLYVGDGWVTLHRTFNSTDAEAYQRVFRTKNPKVTYRIERKRVPVPEAQP
jgi:hypothetical protein